MRNDNKLGLWIIGALGDISTTLIVGTCAMRKGLSSQTGMVTALPPLNELDLVSLENIVFGGCDIHKETLPNIALEVCRRSRTYSHEILGALDDELHAINKNIVIEPSFNWSGPVVDAALPPLPDIIRKMQGQLTQFKKRHALTHVVVVNLASAEAIPPVSEDHKSIAGVERLIASDARSLLSPSMCFAYAAFTSGCSYLNFTSSTGAAIDGLQQLAKQAGVPHYGNDGKTGETLVKTALAPMFLYRNLQVMSWDGTNILGNNDGKTLADPSRRAGKLQNKSAVLNKILKYPVHSDITINYAPSLGDWKTAWDLIHFKGFLDVPMSMQFTWQGCDSILAAPLVLDMARLSEYAAYRKESGLMRHLASFFKNPLNVDEMAFFPQYEMLLEYAYRHLAQHENQQSGAG